MSVREAKPERAALLRAEPLLDWFRSAKRDLPWRRRYDPYEVWISESMLQQTQMERVVPRFLRWMERWPDLAALAAAREDEVLVLWEGLGYYARARNLLTGARIVAERFSGTLPQEEEALRTLPGVGPYTAAAVRTVAWNLPAAAIDANAFRVFARLLDEKRPDGPATRRLFSDHILLLMRSAPPRAIAEGIMELGALVCTAAGRGNTLRVRCGECPWKDACEARLQETVALRPIAPPKKETRIVRGVALLAMQKNKLLLRRRPDGGPWAGMEEFPWVEAAPGKDPRVAAAGLASSLRLCGNLLRMGEVRQSYTTHRLRMEIFLAEEEEGPTTFPYRWVQSSEMAGIALPSWARKAMSLPELRRRCG